MNIEVVQSNDVTIVVPRGELDMAAAEPLREALGELVDKGRTRLVLDLAGVGYIDSAGIGALVSGLKRARAVGGDLRLCGLGHDVRAIFALTRLDRAMVIESTRDRAAASW